jgi:ribosomal-protein-serine acetyltransferase
VFALQVRPGLEIALLELRHAAAVFNAVESEREYLSEWLPWAQQTATMADVEEFIDRSLKKFAAQDGFDAGVWLEGHYIGGFGMHYWDRINWRTEIGYWLRRQYTGRGLMTECVRRALRFAFDDLRMRRVEIRCAVGNVKSRAIPERLGFKHEGTLRGAQLLHGDWIDLAVYGLLVTDQPSTSSAAWSSLAV